MELYVLDSLLRRIQVVDAYESLIWTERYSEIGDFELDIKSTLETRGQFITGTRLANNNSYRVMTVETVEDSTDSDGKQMLKVKGRSLESLLDDRSVINPAGDRFTQPNWLFTDTPANIIRTMFDQIVRNGALSLADEIPFLQPGSLFAAGTIPESTTPINLEQQPDSLYSAVKSLCDSYDLGFRLVREFDMSRLYFDVYTGNDRTTKQTVLSPVIFSAALDNIQNTTEMTNIQQSKNVAYVFSPVGFKVVYGENVPTDISGLDRRVLIVNANDVDVNSPDIDGALTQRGLEELNKNRALSLFDGELNQYNEYTYGVDYDLGDLVEMRNKDGIITYKRVVEQIFVSDTQGERSYPTLSIDAFAGADIWVSWNNDPRTWADMTTEHWTDM